LEQFAEAGLTPAKQRPRSAAKAPAKKAPQPNKASGKAPKKG
jgi:hypothetical protein